MFVLSALRPGQDEGQMDSTGPTHHPVLPGGLFPLRGLHPRVRLQTPLERCTGGSPAGGAHRRAHRESNTGVHIPITPTCVTTLTPPSLLSKVRHVSDFFKQRPPRCTRSDPAENEQLERKPNPQPPDAQRGNHYSYP